MAGTRSFSRWAGSFAEYIPGLTIQASFRTSSIPAATLHAAFPPVRTLYELLQLT